MDGKVYVTGSLICSHCGNFLTPELLRDGNQVPTGKLLVRRHKESCPFYKMVAVVQLAELPILEAVPEVSVES